MNFKNLWFYFKTIKFYVRWFYFIQNYIFDFSFIEGVSMLPTFKEKGSLVLIDKFSHIFFKPKINQIISFYYPYDKRILLCKRIKSFTNKGEKIWVEGDNKKNSIDSKNFGLINSSLINGIIRLQIYPIFKTNFPPIELNQKL